MVVDSLQALGAYLADPGGALDGFAGSSSRFGVVEERWSAIADGPISVQEPTRDTLIARRDA